MIKSNLPLLFLWCWSWPTAVFATDAVDTDGSNKDDAASADTSTDPSNDESIEDKSVEYRIEDGALWAVSSDKKTEITLPAKATGLYRQDRQLFVAVGELGVCVFDIQSDSPTLLRRIPISHGSAVGLFKEGGNVWMKVNSTTAVQLAAGEQGVIAVPEHQQPILETAAPSQKTPLASKPDAENNGKPLDLRIVDVMPGMLKLSGGRDVGIKNGDIFEVYREIQEKDKSGTTYATLVRVAILEVVGVSEKNALAALHRGERVMQTDQVTRPVEKERPSKMFPERLDRIGEVVFNLRPLISVAGDNGGGALMDLSATYYGKSFFTGIRLQPFGVGFTKNGALMSSALFAEAGYGRKAFGIGLGVGFGATSGDMDEMIGGYDYYFSYADSAEAKSKAESKWSGRKKIAFALAQVVRLGPTDGFNIVVVNRLMYYSPSDHVDDDPYNDYGDAGFKYAGTTARLNVPLTHVLDLVTEGGGGQMGYAYGSIGISAWIRGRGDVGSIAVSACAGGASIWGSYKKEDGDVEDVFVVGPLVGLGIKARFGPKTF